MQFTVSICTYRREALLAGTLKSLADQTLDRHEYELLIIDNAGTDDARTVAETYGARYVHERKIGLSHARNRAAAEANTDWIVYLDDDIIAPNDLLAKFHLRTQTDSYSVVGGNFTHWFRVPPPGWLYKYYGDRMEPTPATAFTTVPNGSYLFGGVMAVRKSSLLEVGGFRPEFGMTGTTVATGEEDALQDSLRRAGHLIAYDPSITIQHLVQPYKYSLSGQVRLAFAHGKAHQRIHRQAIGQKFSSIAFAWLRISTYSLPFNVARWMLKPGYFWQHAYLDTVSKYAFECGRILA